MNILVIGKGGREHALAAALQLEGHHVTVAPGNPGMASLGIPVRPADLGSIPDLVAVARALQAHLVVVGPEDPLAAGAADALRAGGFSVVGPGREGARLESSKSFAKRVMREASVPTAASWSVADTGMLREAVQALGGAVVLKADGLAQGKGVIVPGPGDALAAGEELFRRHGPLVVEERLSGEEVSLFVLTDGKRASVMPLAHDHKRRHDGNLGPMTGGMGAVAPVGGADQTQALVEQTVLPVLDWMAWAGIPYRGVLYVGLMLTERGPRVLEYNVRFGDPETEAVLPLVEGGLAERLLQVAAGQVDESALPTRAAFACGVVVASAAYPDVQTGQAIDFEGGGGEAGEYLFWAGVGGEGDALKVAGGRVAVATGVASSKDEARRKAYALADRIHFEGRAWRTDIGWEDTRET